MARADLKTKPTETSVPAFIDTIADPERRADAQRLTQILHTITGLDPKMWGPAIVGFGSYHYKYESGREGDMPRIGFSPRKAATVLYINPYFEEYDALLAQLGKHTRGVGCLNLKRLQDANEAVLKKILQHSLAATRKKYGK